MDKQEVEQFIPICISKVDEINNEDEHLYIFHDHFELNGEVVNKKVACDFLLKLAQEYTDAYERGSLVT